MRIDLSAIRFCDGGPTLNEFGGTITPGLGSPMQRVDRMGDRWMWRFETPRVPFEPEGRRWAALLVRAKKTRVVVPIVQKDFVVGACGVPRVKTATPAGRFLPLKGLTPGYSIREGQWVNYVVGGRAYLDMIVAPTIASAAGEATIEIANLLRASLAVDGVIEMAQPAIEGILADVLEWPVMLDGTTSFSITVAEDA